MDTALLDPPQAACAEKRHNAAPTRDFTSRVIGMRALIEAREVLGPVALAECMGCAPRSLRAKLAGDRPLHDAEIEAVAAALERTAAAISVQAGNVRRMLAGLPDGR